MTKLLLIAFFVFFNFLPLPVLLIAQNKQELFEMAEKARQSGNFDQAEKYLNKMLLLKDSITERNKVAIYNLLGMTNDDAGRYETAIKYYKNASEILIKNFGEDYSILSGLYNNIAISYKMKGDYEKALEYYNIALYKVDESTLEIKEKLQEKSRLFLNSGIIYVQNEDYQKAIHFFEKSMEIKKKYGFKGLENVYINLARTFEKKNDFIKAEFYYQKCINTWEKKRNFDINFIPAAAYKDYASLLLKLGKTNKALDYYYKSKKIHEQFYGLRHPFTANSYLSIGNYYFQQKETLSALRFYQKSIIANTKKFKDSSLFSLPKAVDIISDRQMVRSLQKRAETLLLYSASMKNKDDRVLFLKETIKSAEMAIGLIAGIRRGYLTKTSKLAITQDEKAFYFLASEASIKLYELLKEQNYKKQAYKYVQKSKASLLSEEIIANRAFSAILPDSIRTIKHQTENNIYIIKKLIYDENQKAKPREEKIKTWSDKLFKLNNEYESLIAYIQNLSPEYKHLKEKSTIADLNILQKKLQSNQTIIEYSLSPLEDNNERKLIVFIITKNTFNYYHTQLKADFKQNINSVRGQMNNREGMVSGLDEYNSLNKKLFELYAQLLKPVEKVLEGNELFIIPDEEISYLSFDALQKHYTPQEMINYSALPYLIYDYCISYAYASNLLFQDGPQRKSNYVYAFAPEYEGDGLSNIRFQFGRLENTEKEIKAIFKWFNGEALIGRKANEEFFKGISGEEGIFHFAMHASSEKGNPDFSFLAINRTDSTEEDGFFYNYEIAMMNMHASLVVLSGCNTGDGIISSGEGLMSLSRNFILAGAPSIVHSLWEVQDETSVMVMDKFYEYLSKGIPKNKALYQAKLDYINSVSPAMANPYYWSGYVHIGDPRPLAGYTYFYYLAGALILLVLIGVTVFIVKKKAVLKRF